MHALEEMKTTAYVRMLWTMIVTHLIDCKVTLKLCPLDQVEEDGVLLSNESRADVA